ncbi:Parkin coregulated gene protein, partial [Plecturocebus cupreus]
MDCYNLAFSCVLRLCGMYFLCDFSELYSISCLPQLECGGMVIAYCSLKLLGSNDPPTSASQIAEHEPMCSYVTFPK